MFYTSQFKTFVLKKKNKKTKSSVTDWRKYLLVIYLIKYLLMYKITLTSQ